MSKNKFILRVGSYTGLRPKLKDVPVTDLKEAREEVLERFIRARDWAGGEVLDAETRECVAVVSPNGRVWKPGGYNPEGLRLPSSVEIEVPR